MCIFLYSTEQVLAERSRHFIREEDVTLLSPPNTGKEVKPEFRYVNQSKHVIAFYEPHSPSPPPPPPPHLKINVWCNNLIIR